MVEVISHLCEPSERVSGLDHEAARRTGQMNVGSVKDASSPYSLTEGVRSERVSAGSGGPGRERGAQCPHARALR